MLGIDDAHKAILSFKTVRMEIANSRDEDPVILIRRDGDAIMAESIAGWSVGVVEPVCAYNSNFLWEYITGGVLTLEGQPPPAKQGKNDY